MTMRIRMFLSICHAMPISGCRKQAEKGSQWFAGAGNRRKKEKPCCSPLCVLPAELFLFFWFPGQASDEQEQDIFTDGD